MSGKRTMTLKQTRQVKEMLMKLEYALENKNDIQAELALLLESFLNAEGHIPKAGITKPETDAKRKKGNVHGNSAVHRSNLGDSDKRITHTKAA